MSRGGCGTEQILPRFPEILGELSMCKQCVLGSFSSAHAQEPGNEATHLPEKKRQMGPMCHVSCYIFNTLELVSLKDKFLLSILV